MHVLWGSSGAEVTSNLFGEKQYCSHKVMYQDVCLVFLQHAGHLDVGSEAAAGGGGQAAARESYELRQTEEQPAACNVRKHIHYIYVHL